ncbi:hypothetical protein HK102_005766, partial [Quaeritorhiza haematococci]
MLITLSILLTAACSQVQAIIISTESSCSNSTYDVNGTTITNLAGCTFKVVEALECVEAAARYPSADISHCDSPSTVNPRHRLTKRIPRPCQVTSEVQIEGESTWPDWDVAITPVVTCGAWPCRAELKGANIPNILWVDGQVSHESVRVALLNHIGIDFSTEYWVDFGRRFHFMIPVNSIGLGIINPVTTERWGKVVESGSGCQFRHESSFKARQRYPEGGNAVRGRYSNHFKFGETDPPVRCLVGD